MKSNRPTTPSRRHMTDPTDRSKVSTAGPSKQLTTGKRSTGGRNSGGRMTTRHKGGGHKRRHRLVDFKYDKRDVPATVESIEYDPNRSAHIALVLYADGERRYIVAPADLQIGDEVVVSADADIRPGNRLRLENAPVGTFVYNIELKPDGGAKLARSAGNSAEVQAKGKKYVTLKLPSSEVRRVPKRAWASVGSVSNSEHRLRTLGKAGANRWRGKRPTVRGKVMNPVDHPHAGGEAHRTRGTRRAKTKWGKPVGKGQKTRKPNKYSDKLIVRRRKDKHS